MTAVTYTLPSACPPAWRGEVKNWFEFLPEQFHPRLQFALETSCATSKAKGEDEHGTIKRIVGSLRAIHRDMNKKRDGSAWYCIRDFLAFADTKTAEPAPPRPLCLPPSFADGKAFAKFLHDTAKPLAARFAEVLDDDLDELSRVGRETGLEWESAIRATCTGMQKHDVERLLEVINTPEDWIGAPPPASKPTPPTTSNKPPSQISKKADVHYAAEVELTSGASITPEAVKWLWNGFLAGGKLHVFAGSPGTGKTTAALALAAVITSRGRWPDGTPAPLGNVAIWSGEDDPADTLAPRLLAAGADIRRVFFVSATREVGGERRPFDPATDTRHLMRALAGRDVKLLIVDPIVSAVAGDSHKSTETRRALQPLVDLAAATGAAVLGISHFSKGTQGRDPVERVTGSIAFGALARVVFAAAKASLDDAPEDGDRIFIRSKSNIGKDGGGFRYALEQVPVPGHPDISASRVRWGGALEGEARELLAAAEVQGDPEERNALADAMSFLRDLLADGAMSARTVKADGDAAGHAWRTLHRAADKLGVLIVKEGMKGGWTWKLP